MERNSKLIVYGSAISPPCRTIYIVAEALGINIEKREVSLLDGDHLKPEYLKINPLHSIPALDNNGWILIDSHAIATYLIDKYGNNSNLYPTDLEIRSQIDSKLYFDVGYLFNALKTAALPYLLGIQKGPLTDNQKQQIMDNYNFLNTLLQNKTWIVDDNVTVADICLYTTITSLMVLVPLNISQYANISKWLRNFEKLPYAKVNKDGLDAYEKAWIYLTKSN